MEIKAYAKLNLYLDITGRRADGYHELDMIMQTVDLFDSVFIEPAQDDRAFAEGISETDNIAARAARAFFAASGRTGGAHIRIQKRIPAEAGMGGGSADAAAVLRGLNGLYGQALDESELYRLALGLGADVPFALFGGTAAARGTGELLTRIESRLDLPYVIIKPACGVPTSKAFALFDSMACAHSGGSEHCAHALAAGDAEAFFAGTYNALTAPAVKLCPEVNTALGLLRGARGCLGSLMTGSGSACVGVFDSEDSAAEAAGSLDGRLEGARIYRARNL